MLYGERSAVWDQAENRLHAQKALLEVLIPPLSSPGWGIDRAPAGALNQDVADPSDQERAYKLAYEEGVRALSQQQSVIDGYRTRAGMLLSAAAVATSFFGGQALKGGGLSGASWVGIALFAGLGVALLAVMTPGRLVNLIRRGEAREGLAGFVASPSILVGDYVEADPPLSAATTYRDVSLYMEERWEQIENRLVRRLDLRFRIASGLLIAEMAAWVVELA